jgi:xanthine/CO dehydrogenase XdhC/CoxF family maturation factor
MTEIAGWFAGRCPDGWFTEAPEVTVDREEVLVIGRIQAPDAGAEVGRAKRFREETRDARMQIAEEAEERFGRKVSWGIAVGDERYLFTHLAVPVMTRLRQRERVVLDTLIDAGVARSRSDALAWCVRLVEKHEGEWIQELRDALVHVEAVKQRGPAD